MKTATLWRAAPGSLLSLALAAACGAATQSSHYTSEPITLGTGGYSLNFSVAWTCDDFPQPTASAPGQIDLIDGAGNLAGRLTATIGSGSPVAGVQGAGTVSGAAASVARLGAGGTPADGTLSGNWLISGLAPGAYTLRFWFFQEAEQGYSASTIWTRAMDAGGSAEVNPAPGPGPAPTSGPGPAAPVFYTLTVTATAGGTAAGGGSYPPGAQATLEASPNPGFAFSGWSGGATGEAQTLTVLMSSSLSVTANFAPLLPQTISFVPPQSVSTRTPPFTLVATSSSGLPVLLTLDSGPVALAANVVAPTGSQGTAVLTATQPGNAEYLPAPPVLISFPVGAPPPGVLLRDDSAATKRSDKDTPVTSLRSGSGG